MIILNKSFKCVAQNYRGFRHILMNRKSFLSSNVHTAGVIVIGDEILKGQVVDTNTHFFAKELYQRGYSLQRVIVVPDDVTTISNTIRTFSTNYHVVLTSGGIGPTHDDVTYAAAAHAFDDTLYYNPQIVEMCKQFFKTNDESHPCMKLALIPFSSKLTFGLDKATGKKSLYPNVSLKNVFIFPGVPHLCQRMFNFNKDELFPAVGKYFTSRVYIDANESDITGELNETVKKFPNIVFGSYPTFFHSYYSVKISLESRSEQEVFDAVDFLKLKINSVINYDETCFGNKLEKLKALNFSKLNILMDNFKSLVTENNAENIYVYFDGGKNSILILHVLSAIFKDKKINVVFVDGNVKVIKFVENFVRNYNCNFVKLSENNFKKFLNLDRNMVLVKGTRKSDPKFNEIFNYFKQFNLFNPLESWDYHEVWEIIRKLNLPYCELYDQGYASLNGSINNDLIVKGHPSGLKFFKRGHLLSHKSLE